MIIRTVVRIMEQVVPLLHSTAIVIQQGDIGIYINLYLSLDNNNNNNNNNNI